MTIFYGYDRGDEYVTQDTSTTSKEIELAVDETAVTSSADIWDAIRKIKMHVEHDQG